jgi:hypothetical protein
MNKTLSNIVIFAMGAVAGSLATWQFVKKKYEQIAQEEIDSVKEAFKYTSEPQEGQTEEAPLVEDMSELNMKEYAEKLAKERYNGDSNDLKKVGTEDEKTTYPRVITPEEFGSYEGYATVDLIYYADETLADDFGKIYDVDETIGIESLDSIGEFEEDCVHVRNYELKTDFEIFVDSRRYSEVFGTHD